MLQRVRPCRPCTMSYPSICKCEEGVGLSGLLVKESVLVLRLLSFKDSLEFPLMSHLHTADVFITDQDEYRRAVRMRIQILNNKKRSKKITNSAASTVHSLTSYDPEGQISKIEHSA